MVKSEVEVLREMRSSEGFSSQGIADGVPNKKKLSNKFFRMEYFTKEDDLVIHFYMPDAAKPDDAWRAYWTQTFPYVMDEVAQNVFEATYPRLEAAYIADHELFSYWFRARGFGLVADPDMLVKRFETKLSEALAVARTGTLGSAS